MVDWDYLYNVVYNLK